MPKSTPVVRKKTTDNSEILVSDTASPPRKPRKRSPRKTVNKKPPIWYQNKFFLLGVEIISLVVTAVSAIIVLLGYSANWFSGSHFFSNLLPFALGVLGLILLTSILLIGWWKLHQLCRVKSIFLSPTLASCLAAVMLWFSLQDSFTLALGHYRSLVGGKQEASRITLAHQVFAAYRRYNQAQLQLMLSRAQEYNAALTEAANEFDLDVNLLQGIAATESSFLPRESVDGGQGLFQITLVPNIVTERAAKALKLSKLSLNNPRHNAFIAAATFKHYLAEMHGDLFLGLLAYNIGPKNGGLRFIMQQYGATDFVTIQPYLQQLPRDYPIRVLSYALAFRLWQKEGKLLVYEEGKNALRIQRIGVPGLETEL